MSEILQPPGVKIMYTRDFNVVAVEGKRVSKEEAAAAAAAASAPAGKKAPAKAQAKKA